MKAKFMMLSMVAFAMTFGTVGCKKETPAPAPAPAPAPTPAPAPKTTAKITVKTKQKGTTTILTDCVVVMATSLDDIDAEIYLKELKTNSSGVANLGEISPGNYYIAAFDVNEEFYGQRQIQVVANADQDITLDLDYW